MDGVFLPGTSSLLVECYSTITLKLEIPVRALPAVVSCSTSCYKNLVRKYHQVLPNTTVERYDELQDNIPATS
jgi:hypothetical protein